MINYISGELTDIEDNIIVVEAYGVGYEINVPTSILPSLPEPGDFVKIYTYQHVKEDALDLYGFLNKEDIRIFRLLISVSGIGPKGALSVLSAISSDEIKLAVVTDDVKKIQSAPGIGLKTAQKIIIELKDKLKLESISYIPDSSDIIINDSKKEAVEALISLGYSSSEANRAVSGIAVTDDMTSEDILKKALRQLAFM